MNRFLNIIICFLIFHNCLSAQPASTTGIINSFKAYRNKSLTEKLFVHTDKASYLAGEICWFKIYAVDGSFHKPLDLSKVAYVEILSVENKPVLQAMVAMQDATGAGSFLLPTSLVTGQYTFRAYTNWMKNEVADYDFQKPISIINTLKKATGNTANDSSYYDAQFFPEGGNLVNGINSLIAFKVTDKAGKGVDCNGIITTQENKTVASFSSLKFGMGKFYLKPIAGEKYKAVITTNDKKTITTTLPEIFTTGCVMHAETGSGSLIKITATTNTSSSSAVYLFVHTRLSFKTVLNAKSENGIAEFTIDKKILGEGISQLTLFDEQLKPLAERLFFKRPADKLNITLGTNSQQYSKRKKVQLDMFTENNGKEKQIADMSVAVVLMDEMQQPENENILSYLWLTSDLKGRIENAKYYFTDSSAAVMEAADNLMLTQGWRRFDWAKIAAASTSEPAFLPETDGHVVKGTVTDKRTGKPAANINAYTTVTGRPFTFKSAVSNQAGEFIMDMPLFYGSNEMIVQPNHVDSNYRIDIANPFSENYTSGQQPLFNLSAQFQNALSKRSIGTQVQQVYNAEKTNRFYSNNTDSTNFYGPGTTTYYLDDYTRFITMEEVIREYVKELRLRKSKDQYELDIKNSTETDFKAAPLVLLDGMPVFDLNKLIALDPLKIRKIDVVQKQYYYGALHVDGIASFASYKADLAGIALDPSALLLEYPGLQLQREFYSPQYESTEQANSRLPDFRNTLYWNPFAASDKNGKLNLSFFTGDQTGNYAIIVQGITAEGLAGSATTQVVVQ